MYSVLFLKKYIALPLELYLATMTISIISPISWGGDPAIWRKVKEGHSVREHHPPSEFTSICSCFLKNLTPLFSDILNSPFSLTWTLLNDF